MKKTYYFPHDYNARNDQKISALLSDYGAAGYGVYWCIVEILHEEEGNRVQLKELFYRAVSKQLNIDVDTIKKIISDCISIYELFQEEDNYLYSERVLKNVEYRESISRVRSQAGKAGAAVRNNAGKSSSSLANAEQVLANAEQNSANKIKGNKSKDSIEFSVFWDAYGKKSDRSKTEKKWNSLPVPTQQVIIQAVPAYVASTPDPKFRKNPLTYLNGQCWLDEIEAPQSNLIPKPFSLNDKLRAQAAGTTVH